MDRINLVNLAVFCVALFLFDAVLTASHYGNHQMNIRPEQVSDKKQSILWIGAKQDRRKRNSNNDESDRNELATLLDLVQDSPWALLAVNNGKRHVVNFTPRLGRESGEDFTAFEDRWLQDSDVPNELSNKRSPPFAPRLGRNLSPFSPRLGRDSDKRLFA